MESGFRGGEGVLLNLGDLLKRIQRFPAKGSGEFLRGIIWSSNGWRENRASVAGEDGGGSTCAYLHKMVEYRGVKEVSNGSRFRYNSHVRKVG